VKAPKRKVWSDTRTDTGSIPRRRDERAANADIRIISPFFHDGQRARR